MSNVALPLFGAFCQLLQTPLIAHGGEASQPVLATIDAANPQWTISPYLVGLHQVYCHAPDAAYADGRIADWARRAGIATSRFPGGTVVKYWDWERPTGILNRDSWSPEWNPADQVPDSQWMSLDEYLAFVKASGIRPMFGVNSLSGEMNNRRRDGIDRAARMVRYVKERGYGGALWYIGNEEEGSYPGKIAGYAKVFHEYATAMKAVDPDIVIFWNNNHATAASVQLFLANDGGAADGLETHGKWPYGGEPKDDFGNGTLQGWQAEAPLRDRKNSNRAWRDAANEYRSAAAAAGRPGLLIANNEYGLGSSKRLIGFDRYTTGLLLTEFLMEHFIGNWFSTCFWDMSRGAEDGLLDTANGFRLNPFHFGMEMLANAHGGTYLSVDTSDPCVHGFATMKDGTCLLYLINKTLKEHNVEIQLQGLSRPSGFGRLMRDTKDKYGELAPLQISGSGSRFEVALPSLTFAEIAFVQENENPFR
ncbi:MAG: hypothetical protein NTW86_14560 [Candidatus Sumerlaeota bacterium]|nr:hypothetical protein [Candidatus Sumerlaeota bacterium]